MIEGLGKVLSRLSGGRLIALGRAADLQWFTFTIDDADESRINLHVTCPWRIVDSTGILVGAADYHRPAGSNTAETYFDDRLAGSTFRDKRNDEVAKMLGSDGIKVLSADADAIGSLKIRLDGDIVLDVFPDSSSGPHDEIEFWRLFESDGPHLVVGSDGLDYVADV